MNTYKTTELFLGFRFSNTGRIVATTDYNYWWDVFDNRCIIELSDDSMVYNMTTDKFSKDQLSSYSNLIQLEFGDLTEMLRSGLDQSDYPITTSAYFVNMSNRQLVLSVNDDLNTNNYTLDHRQVLHVELLFNFNVFEPLYEVYRCWVDDNHEFTSSRPYQAVCEYPSTIIKGVPLF